MFWHHWSSPLKDLSAFLKPSHFYSGIFTGTWWATSQPSVCRLKGNAMLWSRGCHNCSRRACQSYGCSDCNHEPPLHEFWFSWICDGLWCGEGSGRKSPLWGRERGGLQGDHQGLVELHRLGLQQHQAGPGQAGEVQEESQPPQVSSEAD